MPRYATGCHSQCCSLQGIAPFGDDICLLAFMLAQAGGQEGAPAAAGGDSGSAESLPHEAQRPEVLCSHVTLPFAEAPNTSNAHATPQHCPLLLTEVLFKVDTQVDVGHRTCLQILLGIIRKSCWGSYSCALLGWDCS